MSQSIQRPVGVFATLASCLALVIGVVGTPAAVAASAPEEATVEEARLHCQAAGYMEWVGLVSDPADGASAIGHIACGNYVDGALFVAGALIPFVPGSGLVKVKDGAVWISRKIGEFATRVWDWIFGKAAKRADGDSVRLPLVKMSDVRISERIGTGVFTTNGYGVPVEAQWLPVYIRKADREPVSEALKREVWADAPQHLNRSDYQVGHIQAAAASGPATRQNLTLIHKDANNAQKLVEYELRRLELEGKAPYVRAKIVGDPQSSLPDGYVFEILTTDPKTGKLVHYRTVEIPNSAAAKQITMPWVPVVVPPIGSTEQPPDPAGSRQGGSKSRSNTDTGHVPSSGVFVAVVGSFRSGDDARTERDALSRRYERSFDVTLLGNWWAVHTRAMYASEGEARSACRSMRREIPDECYPLLSPNA